MVLVLSLPEAFEHRDFLITVTYGVVLISILLQGLTMGPLLNAMGIIPGKQGHVAYEMARGELRAATAALDEAIRDVVAVGADPTDASDGGVPPSETPALSPLGLGVLVAALIGVGVWRRRRRQ